LFGLFSFRLPTFFFIWRATYALVRHVSSAPTAARENLKRVEQLDNVVTPSASHRPLQKGGKESSFYLYIVTRIIVILNSIHQCFYVFHRALVHHGANRLTVCVGGQFRTELTVPSHSPGLSPFSLSLSLSLNSDSIMYLYSFLLWKCYRNSEVSSKKMVIKK
jgi:hypothetical protein